ncbi:MAG TPA: Phenylacetic acid catabolic protein, partial [Candidatus Limnocylindrales bacterium]|nr:Phenylacetic acid catabolic protein [Candidatus Limnocylindrales bacterium]
RREERYHRMHLVAWVRRLAEAGGDAKARLETALAALGPDADTVFAPLAGEEALLDAGVLTRSMAAAEAAWRGDLTTILVPLGLELPPHLSAAAPGESNRFGAGRLRHGDAFRWLWGEFTSVRRSDPGATW